MDRASGPVVQARHPLQPDRPRRVEKVEILVVTSAGSSLILIAPAIARLLRSSKLVTVVVVLRLACFFHWKVVGGGDSFRSIPEIQAAMP